jgi:hypothetical protein
MKKKTKIILCLVFGVPLVLVILAIVVWSSSTTVQERTYEAALGINRYIPQRLASKESMLSLVVFVNVKDKSTEKGQDVAERAMVSLILLSGQDFGTGFKGDPGNYTWGPPVDDEDWKKSLARVNAWAFETFGPELLILLPKGTVIEQKQGDGNETPNP